MSMSDCQVTASTPSTETTDTRDKDTAVVCDSNRATLSKPGNSGNARKKLHGLKVPKDLNQKLEDCPTQPKLAKFPLTKFGSQNRSFSASYYANFDFLEHSIERDAVFCFCCRLFPCSSAEPVFTQYGFNNWKDIGECAKNNASSFLSRRNCCAIASISVRLRGKDLLSVGQRV